MGNWESGIGNGELGIWNWELGIGIVLNYELRTICRGSAKSAYPLLPQQGATTLLPQQGATTGGKPLQSPSIYFWFPSIRSRKSFTVNSKPLSSGIVGSHPNQLLARVISGCRCFGSSCGSGLKMISAPGLIMF
jgi:hypothetical protein